MREEGVLFNNFLFDEIKKLEDIIIRYGSGQIAYLYTETSRHTSLVSSDEIISIYPEVKQKYYWVHNNNRYLKDPEFWSLEKAMKEWEKARNEMQKEWNIKKSWKNVYIHMRRYQMFDFWWTKHYIGKRIRMGYYKGSPQVVTFIIKSLEIKRMTEGRENMKYIDRVKETLERKRIPLHDKIKPIKGTRNEFYVPPKFVIDPKIVLQYY